jgi:DNA repair exonuclease SbcCD ATPase subunit
MEHKELKSKVGKSATKIWDAYQDAVEELKRVSGSEPISTTERAKRVKTNKAVEKTLGLNISEIESNINTLMKNLTEAKEKFDEAEWAIAAKKQELMDVHNLEVEANSLVAIVAAKDKLVSEKEQEAHSILEKAKLEAEEVLTNANARLIEVRNQISRERQEETTRRARELEEYEYEFERQKTKNMDEVKDTIAKIMKDADSRIEAVIEREEKAQELEDKVKDFEATIEKMKISTQSEIERAIEKAKESATASANIAKSLQKKDYEAEINLANAKASTLEEQVNDLKKRLSEAEERVQAANLKVSEMAQSALKAGADAATVAEVSKIAAGSQKK